MFQALVLALWATFCIYDTLGPTFIYAGRPLIAGTVDALNVVRHGTPMMTTNVRHIALTPSTSGTFEDHETPDQESDPNGNAVSLEMEMIKVSETQAQFQAAANLYAKAMTMMKTAIGH